jgi:hypothetical protein
MMAETRQAIVFTVSISLDPNPYEQPHEAEEADHRSRAYEKVFHLVT